MLVFDYYDYPHVSDRRPERPKSHQPRATPWVNQGIWKERECGGNISLTSGEVKIGDNVVAMLRTWTGSCKSQDGGSFYMDRTKIVSLHKEFQIGETADKTFKHYNITILHYYKMLVLDYCL